MGCLQSKQGSGAGGKNLNSIEVKTGDYKVLSKKYEINPKCLGAGNFGKVFLGTSVADKSFKVAIKTLPKAKLIDQLDAIKDEMKILSTLDHPNIIKYYETFESPKYIYIVMEYCAGGELFDRITKNKETFSEESVAQIMEKLFLAVNHCHAKKIAHRDLKPENVIYAEDKPDADIKIIDFGLSR